MRSNDPESIVFSTEALYGSTLIRVPYSNCLVFANTQNQVLTFVEKGSRSIVEMTSASIDFPRFRFRHSPNFDETVIPGGDEEREGWMERDPIDSSIVSFENILYRGIGISKNVAGLRVVVLD